MNFTSTLEIQGSVPVHSLQPVSSINILPSEIFTNYFSCFSDHKVELDGTLYPTAEHAYHCQRYSDAEIIQEIKKVPSAQQAWEISQKYKFKQIPGFDAIKISVMEEILRAKLAQHADVYQALVDSKDKLIVKDHELDYFWGTGKDKTGRNELGKLWMKLKEKYVKGTL